MLGCARDLFGVFVPALSARSWATNLKIEDESIPKLIALAGSPKT